MANIPGESVVIRAVRFLLRRGILPGEKGKNGKLWARKNRSGIAEFRYRYDGTIGGNNYTYRITQKENGAVFTCEFMGYPAVKSIRTEADPGLLARLNALYEKYRVYKWDGYAKHNTLICDGSGFSLEITFRDGAEFYASGMNAFPARHYEFCEEMNSLLGPIKDELLEKAKEKGDNLSDY